MHNGHNGHPVVVGPIATQEEITQEVLHESRRIGPRLSAALVILGALFVMGIIGFIIRLTGGTGDRAVWGYYAAGFFFVFSVTMGIPIAAIGLRMARAQWRRPTSRAAELFAIVGPLNLLFFLPLMKVLPPLTDENGVANRNSLWMDWQLGPWLPDLLMMIALVLTGLLVLYISALPDLAAVRDHGSGFSQRLASKLSRGWMGTRRQWASHKSAMGIVGAAYIMVYAMTHLVLATDFAMSMVPGWKDPIFPAFHAATALQMGLGLFIVTMFLLRKWGGLGRYFEVEQFWGYSRLLLSLTLFWFYFWWSGFILFWYGRLPHEQAIIGLLVFGDRNEPGLLGRPQFLLFAGAFGLSFALPFLCIMWNRVRRSILGPAVVGLIIISGGLFDRLRLYLNAFSIEQLGGHELENIPTLHLPDAADLMILVGMMAGPIFVYLLAARLIPIVSLWETREALLLRVIRPYYRGHAHVVAKPD